MVMAAMNDMALTRKGREGNNLRNGKLGGVSVYPILLIEGNEFQLDFMRSGDTYFRCRATHSASTL